MDDIIITGIVGSIILVLGSALPEPRKNIQPIKSVKNWLFGIGSFIMLFYAIFGYFGGESIFFVILEILVAISIILMMLNTQDKVDTIILVLSSVALIIWSLYLFESYYTLIFILGLCGVSLGFAFESGTLRRSTALVLGSGLIAVFSYTEMSWIFFWLNLFFAIFSAYYMYKGFVQKRS